PRPSVAAEGGGIGRRALRRERAPADDEQDVAGRRCLELVVGSAVCIRCRVRQPPAGGDLEIVPRLRLEIRQGDRVSGPEIRRVRAEGQGARIDAVSYFRRRRLDGRPLNRRRGRADRRHAHVVNRRAAREDLRLCHRRVRDNQPYPRSRLLVAPSANGCGPTGMFDPITRTDQSPAAGFLRITASSTLVVSKIPPGRDCPCANGAKWFPRYTVPSGAVTSRSRSFTSAFVAPIVPG